MIPPLPLATYRLQFNSAFTFNDARRIVPYLHALGISHCYASPVLKARSGSSHGYDIVDHNALNPELGTSEEFRLFIESLHEFDMGLILDIVPNHMGIGGSDNAWWLDVLENGPASPYAIYFDIDWQPASRILLGKVLLPILGDYYGKVLDRGEIELTFSEEQGSFAARYYEHLLPLDPKTYPQILALVLAFFQENASNTEPLTGRLYQLIADCRQLPGRQATGRHSRAERGERQMEIKRELALLSLEKSVREAIAHGLAFFNTPKTPGKGYDLLHRLLEKQAYRLAFWRVAVDEINYRRFFNVNSLAGLCQEQTEVFNATHRFLFSLIEKGFVQGFRIDHPDGLFDPRDYYARLNAETHRHLPRTADQEGSFYLVAEKILAIHEELPRDWPIHGTTGYDYANLVNGLFINPAGEKPLSQTYRFCTGESTEYAERLYDAKKLIIKTHLASELTVLSNLLIRIAEQDRHTRDFTYIGLREALTEVVACFPVYRTYVTPKKVSTEDRRYVELAVTAAKRRNPVADPAIFDFVHNSLIQASNFDKRRRIQNMVAHFSIKFQQYTAPVMAKAQEDTVFYRDCRLLSLNEVGGEPRSFRVSRTGFHQANRIRQQYWPQSMLTTSTHDSKRSEDVRARLNVLSEIPNLWKQRVRLWMKLNHRHTQRLNGHVAPSRNDEYHLYQTLLGTWPLSSPEGQDLDRYRERIDAYMLKAVREAKIHTSWLNPNSAYEEALASFLSALLQPLPTNRFLTDFTEFTKMISHFGLLNSLSQVLLKLTAPGVPDIYQGNELWNFSLVDPDNRRPVDFIYNQNLLGDLAITFADDEPSEPGIATLLATLPDGRAKLFVTSRTLQFRNKHPALFLEGAYEALPLSGEVEQHLCVLARSLAGQRLIAVAPRFFSSLLPDNNVPYSEIADTVWGQTCLCLPENAMSETYRNIFTGEEHCPIRHDGQVVLMVAPLLRAFPVALLYSSGEKSSHQIDEQGVLRWENAMPPASITKTRFDAVLFDLDGVVTETAKIHASCWKKMFDDFLSEYARKTSQLFIPFDIVSDYNRYVDGKLRQEGVRSFLKSRRIQLPFGGPDAPSGEATIWGLGNRKDDMFMAVLREKGVDILEDGMALVRHVRAKGLNTAVVSSSKNCQAVLKAADIEKYFDVRVDGLTVEKLQIRGKPAPDPFLKAAELLGVSPDRSVVVEDAISGVQAGRRGNFGLVVGVARKGDTEILRKNGADIVVTDLRTLMV